MSRPLLICFSLASLVPFTVGFRVVVDQTPESRDAEDFPDLDLPLEPIATPPMQASGPLEGAMAMPHSTARRDEYTVDAGAVSAGMIGMFAPLNVHSSSVAAEGISLATPNAAVPTTGVAGATSSVVHSSYSGTELRKERPLLVSQATNMDAASFPPPLMAVDAHLSRGAAAALGLATPIAPAPAKARVASATPHRAGSPLTAAHTPEVSSLLEDSPGITGTMAPGLTSTKLAASESSTATDNVAPVLAPTTPGTSSETTQAASLVETGSGTALFAHLGAVGARMASPWRRGGFGSTLGQQAGIAFVFVVFFMCLCLCARGSDKTRERRSGRDGVRNIRSSHRGSRSHRFEAGKPVRPSTTRGELDCEEDVIRSVRDSRGRGSGSSETSPVTGSRAATPETLAEVKALARSLEGPAQKHPRSAQGSASLLDVYIVAVPRPAQEKADLRTAETEMARWRGGCLGWWESKELYKRNSRPDGYVMLKKILSADVCAQDPQWVIVEHRDKELSCKLELAFGTRELASRFGASLENMLEELT